MPLKSLGLASDVMVLGDHCVLEEHPDRFVLRSPAEPNFWFGNMVIFREDHIEAATQIEQFQRDFPDAAHVTLAWDVPNMAQGNQFKAFETLGLQLDISDVLTLRGPIKRTSPPAGIVIRPLSSDRDWAQATELQAITGREEGHEDVDYLPYIRNRMKARRAQTETGFGTWFGAFSGDELAGDLGIFADARSARFQSVETRDSFRRRGICAALVSAGVDWAHHKCPGTRPVIIAERDGAAGRIYRRCGFELSERLIAAYRGPIRSA